MPLGKFIKSPDEIKRYSIDYSNWLDTGEYLASATVTRTPATGIMTINVDTIGASDIDLSFFVSGGTAGVSYKLLVRAVTTNGQAKEDTVTVEVRAI